MADSRLALVEFPADDLERARAFWEGLIEVDLEARRENEGRGRQTHSGGTEIGLHARGPGPGDTWSLPYFAVSDMETALARVTELGGSVIHPGETSAVCRDSEGTPFGLMLPPS
jgi:predicted enzyme related to lactoylglutathione lyase